ncbi:MAG: TolC family protein [Polyangiaceae bacterium]|nr:TolC family protein [Polyangiaceae bacterium]
MRCVTSLSLTLAAVLAAGVAAAESAAAGAAVSPPRTMVVSRHAYDLARCLALAERNFPKIQEARAKLTKKRAERTRSRVQPYDDFDAHAGIAFAPSALGTSFYSGDTDEAIDSDMTLAWQVGVSGAIPLWTFGKISNLWEAADANVRLGQEEVVKVKQEVMLDVRRAYYGLQFARDALSLAREAERQIDKYIRILERRVAEEDGDEVALLKLKMQRAELTARESEAHKNAAAALAGLRFLTGAGQGFDIPDEPLQRLPHPLGPLARYLEAARLHRPEVNMARAGIAARRAQVRIEEARAYPDLGLALSWKWAHAPARTDQKNPFVNDSANVLGYGAGLGLKWNLDFLSGSTRLAAARADLEVARASERFALGGVGAEVEGAYADAADAARRLDAYSEATRYAKQWLVKVQQGIDIGAYEDEDLVDPAKEYALKRLNVMAATYDYNIAMARLALVTGWDLVVGLRGPE